MITIIVNNSYSRIVGLSSTHEKELRELLSYTVGGSSAFFSGYGIRKKSLLTKKWEFPTGLLTIVSGYFEKRKVGFTVIDYRVQPKAIVTYLEPRITPYFEQNRAATLAINQHRGIISMPTGSGKSLVIALIASRLNLKTLVIVPSLEIKKQLIESLKEVLGVGHKITVENIDSRSLTTKKNYGCLIIDEAHHVAARTYQRLNKTAWTNIYYRFFLTATPFRNDKEEQLLFEGIAGQTIYQLDYKNAASKGYIVPVEAYYFEIPKQDMDVYTWAEVYSQLVVNNDVRNERIASLLLSLKHKSVLCLVKEIKHGQILAGMTGLPFVSGADNDSRKYIREFNNGRMSLIGTTGILGEGIDTKPCEYVIIAGLGKAKSQFMQQVGRAVRKYPGKKSAKIVLFRDASHKFLLRHYREQAKIMREEYGINPIKLEGI